jgi:hypothetical protein
MIGYSSDPSVTRYGPGMRNYYIIHYVTAGRGTFNGHRVEKGQGFLITPGMHESYRPSKEEPWSFLWIISEDPAIEYYFKEHRADPESGDFVAVGRGKGGFKWNFPGYGSAIFIVGAKADLPEVPQYRGEVRTLDGGWTVRPLVSHALGDDDFVIKALDAAAVPTVPGDWRKLFGEHFSGKALYTCRFECVKAEKAMLDLGKVGWTCSVKLNGKELPAKFFRPFTWEIETQAGENVLEVTVANMLANAVSDPAQRAKVAAKYPPSGTYDPKQRVWDLENHESGLMGPVQMKLLLAK